MYLKKLKPLLENGIIIHYSRVVREPNMNRRTIILYCIVLDKLNKIQRIKNKNKTLLYDNETTDVNKVFQNKRILYQYLTSNYNFHYSRIII